MENLFLSQIEMLGPALYAVFALGLFLEGEIVLFVGAYLVYEGYLNPFGMVLIALSVVPTGDYMWYSIGRYISHTKPRIKSSADRFVRLVALTLDRRLMTQSAVTLLISKFTYGFHRPTLVRIGMLNVPRRRFIQADIAASWIWIICVSAIGYAAAAGLARFRKYFKFAEIGLLIGILTFLFLSSVASRISSRRLEEK